MLLAVDIGNSQTSLGLFKEDSLTHHFRKETKNSQTSDEWAAFLIPIFNHHQIDLNNIRVSLCSVVPQADGEFVKFCENYLKTTPYHIQPKGPLPFELNVKEPHSVGADRIANVAYVNSKNMYPALVLDFGTAITLDVISNTGDYEGGVILPGTRLAFESLNLKTSQLPSVGQQFPPSVIGKTTVECIQSGVLYGYVDLIEGLLRRTEAELANKPQLFLTGGNSAFFSKHLKFEHEWCPNLTLDGIRLLAEQAL